MDDPTVTAPEDTDTIAGGPEGENPEEQALTYETALKVIGERDETIDELRQKYEEACSLVAQMHAAAVGNNDGPVQGVIEDVANLRAEHEALQAKHAALLERQHASKLREALRTLLTASRAVIRKDISMSDFEKVVSQVFEVFEA